MSVIVETINLTCILYRYEYRKLAKVGLDKSNNPGRVFLYLFQKILNQESQFILSRISTLKSEEMK